MLTTFSSYPWGIIVFVMLALVYALWMLWGFLAIRGERDDFKRLLNESRQKNNSLETYLADAHLAINGFKKELNGLYNKITPPLPRGTVTGGRTVSCRTDIPIVLRFRIPEIALHVHPDYLRTASPGLIDTMARRMARGATDLVEQEAREILKKEVASC